VEASHVLKSIFHSVFDSFDSLSDSRGTRALNFQNVCVYQAMTIWLPRMIRMRGFTLYVLICVLICDRVCPCICSCMCPCMNIVIVV